LRGAQRAITAAGFQIIETGDYPRARATISISTLSLAEDWVGV